MSGRRKCDLVMQGGVTSGVVYPGLVTKLSEQYDFQNIGGTSAGAIAASLTAAAQFARNDPNGDQNAFQQVAAVSNWLGGTSQHGSGSNLFALFQPQPWAAGLFKFATAFLVKDKVKQLLALVNLFWKEIILGALPGLLLGWLAFHPRGFRFAAHAHHLGLATHPHAHGHVGRILAVVALTAIVCATGIAVAAAAGIVLRVSGLSKHFFGLCFGYRKPDPKKAMTLIEWLNGQINTISGINKIPGREKDPLTFGDLLGRGINLRMMTTCLTWGRPFTLPFTTHEFYFSSAEMRNYFPAEVVDWMEKHPPKKKDSTHDDSREPAEHTVSDPVNTSGFFPMPAGEDLPVIVAARFSLSFPFLFCAVPLYAVDFTLRRREPGEPDPSEEEPGGSIGSSEPRVPEHVWFTDGGICNNFPLHLFDGPVPRWPTFGIDLADLRPDRASQGRTWIPDRNQGGLQPIWNRLESRRGFSATSGLVFAIINTARNWVNSLQAIVPGYRDRIVHIYLNKDEGGLNLTMPPKTLADLAKYGCDAADDLIAHFIHGVDSEGKPTPMTWDNQRWIRYRSSVALLETFLANFAHNMNSPEPGDVPYSELIARGPHDPPPGYRFKPEQVPAAQDETARLIGVGDALKGHALHPGSPNPEPTLVIRPNF